MASIEAAGAGSSNVLQVDGNNDNGVRGNAHSLFESYLSNRSQYVHCLKTDSHCLNITYGVPQGSVLGPLLFLI